MADVCAFVSLSVRLLRCSATHDLLGGRRIARAPSYIYLRTCTCAHSSAGMIGVWESINTIDKLSDAWRSLRQESSESLPVLFECLRTAIIISTYEACVLRVRFPRSRAPNLLGNASICPRERVVNAGTPGAGGARCRSPQIAPSERARPTHPALSESDRACQITAGGGLRPPHLC